MNTIKVIYTDRDGIVPKLIRLFTWSEWSHVAIVDGDTVIEAVMGKGVIETPLAELQAESSLWKLEEYPCLDADAIIAAARSQVGKPYDKTAIIGMLFNRDWQEDDSWFCSELVAYSFLQGGRKLFRRDTLNRITPEHLWMLEPTSDLDLDKHL